jgi:hypothetical protein
MAWRITNKGQLDSVNFHFRATVTDVALVNGVATRLDTDGLEDEFRLCREQGGSGGV